MEPSCVPALRVIDSFQVSPTPGSLGSLPDHASIPFTFFDLIWITSPPMNVKHVFFYAFPHPTSYFLSHHLPTLKSSLSLTLQAFYPFAGNFRRTPGTDDKFELYYKERDSVTFTVAEFEGRFDELCSSRARCSGLLQQLVARLPQSDVLQPVLAVQVTIFPEQGIALGVTVNHGACDGTSSMQFMHSWATTCRSKEYPPSAHVVIDRTLIPDPSNLYSVYYNVVRRRLSNSKGEGKASPDTAPHADVVLASFTLKQEHVQRLKQMVSTKSHQMNKSFHCSTLVVAFAYTWVNHVRARCIDPNKKSCFLFPADFRARIQPPLPTTYFGNCVGACIVEAKLTDLMSDDGIVVAAEAIGNAIDGLSVGLKLAEYWPTIFTSLHNVSLLTTAGSPRFRVYDVDFGWGKPAKVEVVSIASTGAVSVADSREEQAGVEIGVALPKGDMVCFEKYFFSGLKLLSE